MYLKLIREKPDGKAVRGKLYLSLPLKGDSGGPIFLCSTLENRDYLIPPLIYPLTMTYSPKFKRPLPLVGGVPNRSGIRFHPGTKPEHSKGCILISRSDEERLKALILSEKETRLEIN